MSEDNIVHQWAPQKGYERRTLPSTSDSWSPEGSVVARYLLHLKVLGISKDPTGADEFYRNALSLREHAVTATATPDEEAAIAQALALGQVSPAEAAKRLAKASKPDDAHEQADRERQMYYTATRAAYVAAVRAIHNWGEDKWLALLRPLIQEAVEAQDEPRWDALHNFCELLRDRELGALAMVASDPTGLREVDETWRYRVGRPELYHLWRLEHAEAAKTVDHEVVGSVEFNASVVTKGPHPRLAEMVGMAPGIYGAGEVLSIARRIVEEQEAIRAAATPERPTRHVRPATFGGQ
jgi:hypothetical protein